MSDPEGAPVLEQSDTAGASAKKSRGRLVVALMVAGVLLIAVVGGLVWMNYTRSPAYSLGLLASAAQNRDWDSVQKYVDVEAIVGKAVDAALGKTLKEDTSGLGALGAELAQSTKPALVQQAKEVLRQSIERGAGAILPNRSWLVSSFVVKQVRSVTYIGDEALVTVEVPLKPGAPFELKLKMKRVDDFWRVVAIENILDFPGVSTN